MPCPGQHARRWRSQRSHSPQRGLASPRIARTTGPARSASAPWRSQGRASTAPSRSVPTTGPSGGREHRRRRAGAGRRGRARLDRLRLDGRRDRSDRRDRGRRACGSARSCRRSRPRGGPRDRVARCVALPGGRLTVAARTAPYTRVHGRAGRHPRHAAPSRSTPTRSSCASRARPGRAASTRTPRRRASRRSSTSMGRRP